MAVIDTILGLGQTQPERVAAVVDGRPITYGAFSARIRQAQAVFAASGLTPERLAVLAMWDRLDGWAAALALRSLGIATLHPQSLSDVAALGLGPIALVSTQAEVTAEARALAAGAAAPLVLAPSGSPATLSAAPEQAAAATPGGHILLTSGTTGTPKKVLIDAANEARNMPLRAQLFGIDANSKVDVFDFGPWTAIGHQWSLCAWSVGASVVVNQGGPRHQTLLEPGLTHAFLHPAMLASLLGTPSLTRNDAVAVLVGGGALSRALWDMARERLSADIRTIVGSTEVGTFALTLVSAPEDLRWHRILPPFDVQVVDEQDRPVPPGVTGVVRMKTTGVEEYLGDPVGSRGFFRDGCFYPGDIGVLREDGCLALEGRIGDVINVAGTKRPSDAIERLLQERLGLAAVCVISLAEGDEEVVQVVLQPTGPIDPADLKAALLAALPGVTAARVHTVADFPRNQMGKIDRMALRQRLLERGA